MKIAVRAVWFQETDSAQGWAGRLYIIKDDGGCGFHTPTRRGSKENVKNGLLKQVTEHVELTEWVELPPRGEHQDSPFP